MRSLRAAVAFLTPFPGVATPGPTALPWFPLVGAGIGALLGVLWWWAEGVWTPAVAAALVLAGDAALTGMLHLDGLSDSADGLLPHLDRERRLEVMRAPDAGPFGVSVLVSVLLVRWSALAALAPHLALLAGTWALGRTVMAVGASRVPYARDEGLASAFVGSATAPILATAALAVGGPLALFGAGAGLAALAAGALAGAAVLALARSRLGGFTGDVLGAAGVVAETAALLAAAALA